MDKATEKALKTWYPEVHRLYRDPEHPTIKLAGEIGELLDLWAKDRFKPKFSWEQCKNCSDSDCRCDNETLFYTPLILDELGDIWYYLRILAWMYEIEFIKSVAWYTIPDAIKAMYHHADNILNGGNHSGRRFEIAYRLQCIYDCLICILSRLDTAIEILTELNYQKLNSEPTNHGWKGA